MVLMHSSVGLRQTLAVAADSGSILTQLRKLLAIDAYLSSTT